MTTLQDKTPEELNEMLAELRGWEWKPYGDGWGWYLEGKMVWADSSSRLLPKKPKCPLPPYATSYDAIMPCVKALTDKQTFAFIEHLRVIRNIQATGDFAFTWLMMTSSEADLTRALILTLTT